MRSRYCRRISLSIVVDIFDILGGEEFLLYIS